MRVSADRAKRRRLGALVVAALAALVAGVAVGAGGDPSARDASDAAASRDRTDTVETPLRRDAGPASTAGGLRSAAAREAGQAIVLRFAGTSPPAYVLRALRQRRAGGVVLFGDNVVSPPQLGALTAALQRAAGGRALVMIDQEGGPIRNVPWAAPAQAPPALATADAAHDAARATARDLRTAGVNVNLAPVADVASAPGSVMATRAFPGEADQVAGLVAATVRGYAGSGVLATAKHFPGLGRSTVNTDAAAATVVGRGELEPFAAAVDAGVPLVMTSHALYPELDPRRIASQSRRIVEGLLRERLGFDGVVITDSLEAQAVVRRTSTPTAAARSLLAGNDLLLTTGRGSYLDVLRRLMADAQRSDAFRARLREATARAAALRP